MLQRWVCRSCLRVEVKWNHSDPGQPSSLLKQQPKLAVMAPKGLNIWVGSSEYLDRCFCDLSKWLIPHRVSFDSFWSLRISYNFLEFLLY